MLPVVLAVFHCFRWYYIFSFWQRKGASKRSTVKPQSSCIRVEETDGLVSGRIWEMLDAQRHIGWAELLLKVCHCCCVPVLSRCCWLITLLSILQPSGVFSCADILLSSPFFSCLCRHCSYIQFHNSPYEQKVPAGCMQAAVRVIDTIVISILLISINEKTYCNLSKNKCEKIS